MNWIGLVTRMDSKSKVSQVFNSNSQGSRLRGRPKADGGIVYKEILLNAKLETGKRSQKAQLTGERLLMRRKSALDCSASEEAAAVAARSLTFREECRLRVF
jgi:hypothetical protein